MKKNKKRNTH